MLADDVEVVDGVDDLANLFLRLVLRRDLVLEVLVEGRVGRRNLLKVTLDYLHATLLFVQASLEVT